MTGDVLFVVDAMITDSVHRPLLLIIGIDIGTKRAHGIPR